MGKFDDFLKDFHFDPATFNAETFQQAITAAHSEDLAADLSIREAKITQQSAAITDLEKENLSLKGKNYDLLMKIPAKSDDKTSGQNGGSGNDGENIPDIDDFFHD